MVRLPTALAVVALVSTGCNACGDSPKRRTWATDNSADLHAASGASGGRGVAYENDADQDADDYGRPRSPGDDNSRLLDTYGAEADNLDKRAVRNAVLRYYAAAVAGDGASGCSLLASGLVEGLVADDRSSAARAGHGTAVACASALATIFREQHDRFLADHVTTMKVADVHVKGNTGLAVLDFTTTPESEILLAREGGSWKIDALTNSPLP